MTDNLFDLRKTTGLSQVDMAALLGVSYSAYRREEVAAAPRNLYLFALKHLAHGQAKPAAAAPARLPIGTVLSKADFNRLKPAERAGHWTQELGVLTKTGEKVDSDGNAAPIGSADADLLPGEIEAYKARHGIPS